MNRDLVNNADVVAAAQAAMEVISRLQRHPAQARAVGAAAVFVLVAEHVGLSAQDLMTATTNLMNYSEGRRPEFAAVAEYLKKELR